MHKENDGTEKFKVRTTFRPDEEIEVEESELTDLIRQNLIVKDDKSGRAASREDDK